jgi:peptidoglycan/xylan/chitin deacetylase (PgdA/CDA1 family)
MKEATRALAALVERGARPIQSTRLAGLKDLIVLGYHRIDDSGGDLSVSRDHFRAHLEWVESEGVGVVSLDDSDLLTKDDAPRVAFTFDDGYQSVAEFAWPELKSRGWPAIVYAVSGYLGGDRRFPWDETRDERSSRLIGTTLLRELADDGMVVGSHSVTHRYLPGLTPDEARAEVRESKRILEDVVGRPVTSFSYPMGGWNRGLRDAIAQAGYHTAVTVLRGRNRVGRDPLVLRRPIVESDPDDFVRIIRGYFDFLRPLDWLREGLKQRRVTLRHVSSARRHQVA